MQAKTIALFNHKGGVGKTCTAVNLAASLTNTFGRRCLVLDMDPQANATRALIGRECEKERLTMRNVLLDDGMNVSDIVLPAGLPGLAVAPADLGLSEVEFKLVSRIRREYVLREKLGSVHRAFDFVFVDCPPSLGLLALNALAAADSVIIPCETQFLSLRGLRHVLDVLRLVQAKLNPDLAVLGVLATKMYVLSKANRETLDCLRGLRDVPVFHSVIPRDVRAEEAPSYGQPLLVYAPEARATAQYVALAREVDEKCRG